MVDVVELVAVVYLVATQVAELATKCVTLAGEHFNFRCPTAGEAKIGTTWSDTH